MITYFRYHLMDFLLYQKEFVLESLRYVEICLSNKYYVEVHCVLDIHGTLNSNQWTPRRAPNSACRLNSMYVLVYQEVDISHCLNVTDDGVLSLLSLCPSLSILVSHGCPLLTPATRDHSTGLKLKQVTWTVY